MVQECTPRALADLYALMSAEDQRAFLRLLGGMSTGEAPFLIASQLPPTEAERFADRVHETLGGLLFPLIFEEARRLARERPEATDAEFDRELLERASRAVEVSHEKITELALARFKEQRDRKPDPEIVRRNVEVCDRRKQDPSHWSLSRLAKAYDLTPRMITKILEAEPEWRRRAEQLDRAGTD
jgi:hypothetical protein